MPATSTATPADGPRIRRLVLWSVFTALLVLGLVLYFWYAGRIVPLIDALGG